ncbi:MAG: GAF domain-containing protein [Ekhidna sp.]|nr:GAF domain-containing protein [Ekhidna sp.]
MAEDLTLIKNGTKEEKYQALIPQIEGLLYGETNLVANMANVAAALKEGLDFLWVGFYLVDSEDELVLGPFQGPVACTRIRKGKGVCGSSWAQEKTLIVPNVDEFPGHIACASASKSEIVLPVMRAGKTIAVLDADSDKLNDFDEVDQKYLEQILDLIH